MAAVSGALCIVAALVALGSIVCCRRQATERALERSAEKIIRDEVKLTADRRTGALLIIPATTAADDPLLKDLIGQAHVIDKPLVRGSLLELFDKTQEGHDGAVIVEVVDRTQPWIHSRYGSFIQTLNDSQIRQPGLSDGIWPGTEGFEAVRGRGGPRNEKKAQKALLDRRRRYQRNFGPV